MKEFRGLAPIRRSNQQLKTDAEAMAEGRLGMSEGEIEQIAGAGQAAAANQAAQDQQAIARSSMGQPGFLGEAAKQSADVSGQAAQAASTARASTLAMDADLQRRRADRITARLAQAADSRRQAITTGIGYGLMGAGMIGGAIGGGSAALAPAVASAAGKGAGAGLVERVKADAAARQATRMYGGPNQPPPTALGWEAGLSDDEEELVLGGGVIDPAQLSE